jgi:hypothetical protein
MTNLPENDAPQLTRIQIYCNALYNLMDENSEVMQVEEGQVKVWKGYMTQACGLVEIPEGVRNRAVKRLGDVGSIQVVEQGRRNYSLGGRSVLSSDRRGMASVSRRDFTI